MSHINISSYESDAARHISGHISPAMLIRPKDKLEQTNQQKSFKNRQASFNLKRPQKVDLLKRQATKSK
jgi:hypothetical protein